MQVDAYAARNKLKGLQRSELLKFWDAFKEGWTVESIEPARFGVRSDFKEFTFSEGGPRAWFVVVSRADNR